MEKKELHAVDFQTMISHLDNYLKIGAIQDYGPQGLQVEAEKKVIRRIALSVDVAPPIIEQSAEWGADMLIVHHGLFWRDVQCLTHGLGQRVRALLKHDIHLYAAHLPLDAHPEVGNNVVLGQMLGLQNIRWWAMHKGIPLAIVGTLPEPMPLSTLVTQINTQLKTESRLLAHGKPLAHEVAILSGGGAKYVDEAKAAGADCYLTGESSHAHYWLSADYAINVIYAGHYATETVGVKALGAHLAELWGIEARFFDHPTGM